MGKALPDELSCPCDRSCYHACNKQNMRQWCKLLLSFFWHDCECVGIGAGRVVLFCDHTLTSKTMLSTEFLISRRLTFVGTTELYLEHHGVKVPLKMRVFIVVYGLKKSRS